MATLHLMTQRDQPYGSVRKCCEMCGLVLVARPDSFWKEHAWVDDEGDYKRSESLLSVRDFVPCTPPAQADFNSAEFDGIRTAPASKE